MLLIGLFGWPAIFAVNIPLAGLSLVLALLWVPKDDRGERAAQPIDVLGIALFSATLLALLFFLMNPCAEPCGCSPSSPRSGPRSRWSTCAAATRSSTCGCSRPTARSCTPTCGRR